MNQFKQEELGEIQMRCQQTIQKKEEEVQELRRAVETLKVSQPRRTQTEKYNLVDKRNIDHEVDGFGLHCYYAANRCGQSFLS